MDTWEREIKKCDRQAQPFRMSVTNWEHRHISPGCISVTRFHGWDRHDNEAQLHNHDVIITTYGTVMAEERRGIGPLHRIKWYRLVLDEGMERNYPQLLHSDTP
jgi:SNF2 family DNA or RNA helicase